MELFWVERCTLTFLERFHIAILSIVIKNAGSGTVFIMDINLDDVGENLSENLIQEPLANTNNFMLNLCCYN